MYTKDEMIKQLYDKINEAKLIIDLRDIKKIGLIYKKTYKELISLEKYNEAFSEYLENIKMSKSAELEIKKQSKNGFGLQPCVLTECYMAQTIANIYNLKDFIDIDDKNSVVPINIVKKLYNFEGYRDGSMFRYAYYNDDIVLAQCGDSSTIDAVFVKNKTQIRIEFKESASKLREIDITGRYDEYGKLIISEKFKKKSPEYIPFIELFNKNTNVFEMAGHNFNISKYLNDKNINNIVKRVLQNKSIDLYIFESDDKLYPILPANLVDSVNFKGSEIRTAGRNGHKVFTPKYLNRIIIESDGVIDKNNNIKMPFIKSNLTKARTKDKISRYKINSLLYIKIEKTEIRDEFVYFKLKDVEQLVPSISLHLAFNKKIQK